MDNTNNREYWDNYTSYWERKIEESNKGEATDNPTYDDQMMFDFLKRMQVNEEDILLDYGCGSMRLFPLFCKVGRQNNYYGVDIAHAAIDIGLKRHSEIVSENIKAFDGIKIPYATNTFDKIICFGVFDACQQEITLSEILRVLKVGGLALVTGKNNNYCIDDEDAIIAEVNARKNGFPNHFTDTIDMIRQLEYNDYVIEDEFYYIKRIDWATGKYVKDMPNHFYNYALLIRKANDKACDFKQFCSSFSNNFSEER